MILDIKNVNGQQAFITMKSFHTYQESESDILLVGTSIDDEPVTVERKSCKICLLWIGQSTKLIYDKEGKLEGLNHD